MPMNAPSTAREALIAELMGELSTMLDRADALLPALNATCDAVTRASAELDGRAAQAEARLASLTEAAQAHAVRHIAQRTQELARRSAEAQAKAMQLAAHAAFSAELAPALGQLQRALRVGKLWWAHAATALSSSLITLALTLYFLTP